MRTLLKLVIAGIICLAPCFCEAQVSLSVRPSVLYSRQPARGTGFPDFYAGMEIGASIPLSDKFQASIQGTVPIGPAVPVFRSNMERVYSWYMPVYAMGLYRFGSDNLRGRVGLLAGILYRHDRFVYYSPYFDRPNESFGWNRLSIGPVAGLDWPLSDRLSLSGELKVFVVQYLRPYANKITCKPNLSVGLTWIVGKGR